ncbi:hypothetical protein AX14_001888 [Amanita brunnescens Koide BX004]|nr:hypothetical protein AX14_001888 [Amanita brunnescens Koide BX004]
MIHNYELLESQPIGGYQVLFQEGPNRWIHKTPLCQYIKDNVFSTTFYLPGGPEELPDELKLQYSLLATLKQSVIKPKGVFGLQEQSELESELSDEEPVQQLADSSDHKEYSTLSPLEGTTFEEEDPFKPRTEPIRVDPLTPLPVKPELKGNAPPKPPNPDPRPDPITGPMVDDKTLSTLGRIPEFKGKHSKAKAFIIDLELYQKMNQKQIITDNILISLTLQNISEDAQQWKENKLVDLNDNTITTKSWLDWEGFKK